MDISRITTIDPATAQGEQAEFLNGIASKFGSVPNFFRTIAHAPQTASAFAAFNGALALTRLSAQQREVIALTQAGFHACPYCSAYHVFAAGKAGVSKDEAMAWLRGAPSTAPEQALARFVRAVLEHRGRIATEDLAALKAAGFDEGHMIEVMAVMAANFFTNFVNLAAQTQVDFPSVAV